MPSPLHVFKVWISIIVFSFSPVQFNSALQGYVFVLVFGCRGVEGSPYINMYL